MCIFFCLDWWRNLIARFTIHTALHICAREVNHGCNRSYYTVQQDDWLFGYWSASDRSPLITGNAFTGPCKGLSGYSYFLYFMSKRFKNKVGMKLQTITSLIFYASLGVAWFGYPVIIMSNFVINNTFLATIFPFLKPLIVITFDPIGTFRICTTILLCIFHAILLNIHFSWPKSFTCLAVAFMFPFFITFIPLVYLWTLFRSSYARFQAKKDPLDDDNDHDD